ncbi:hypothetical protein V6N13_036960 [Hibiscus sabdariffa]
MCQSQVLGLEAKWPSSCESWCMGLHLGWADSELEWVEPGSESHYPITHTGSLKLRKKGKGSTPSIPFDPITENFEKSLKPKPKRRQSPPLPLPPSMAIPN